MKTALIKNALREINKSKSRFFSIFGIVAIGAGFFAGVKAAAPDMRMSADSYFDECNLADFRLVSTFGFDENDVAAINAIDIGKTVYPAYYFDLLVEGADGDNVARVMSLSSYGKNNDYNLLSVVDGRLPEKYNECVIDKGGFASANVELGDSITLKSGTTKDLSDTVSNDTYTVVGFFNSAQYINKSDRGNTTIGSGSIKTLVYIPEENFTLEYYTEVYVTVGELKEFTCYSDEYERRAEEIAALFENVGELRADIRYDEIMEESSQKIADAEKELADGKAKAEEEFAKAEKALSDALTKITDGERELSENEKKLADARKELADAREKLDSGRAEYNDGKAVFEKEIAAAEKKIAENEQKLADGRAELNKKRAEYNAGVAEFESGKAEYELALSDYNSAVEQLNAQYDIYYANLAEYNSGKEQYEAGLNQYNDGLAQYNDFIEKKHGYDSALEQYNTNLSLYNSSYTRYLSAVETYENSLSAYQQSKSQYDEAYADYLERLSAEGDSAELQAIYAQLTERNNALVSAKAELDANKATLDETGAALALTKQKLDEVKVTLDETGALIAAGEAQITQLKATLDASKITLDQTKTQLDAGWEQLSEGKAQLDEAKAQLDAGKTELDKVAEQLDEAEKKFADGKIQLDKAEAELADGEKQLAAGKVLLAGEKAAGQEKLDSALKELENGEKKYSDGIAQTDDAEAKLAEAKTTLSDGKKEYNDGLAEYNEEKAKAEKEIADGEKELAEAKTELSELKNPVWYVFGRDDNIGYAEYSDNAERINNIAKIFPVFFILVAGLVCLTTMTRMVEDQRTQIGTLKALGYNSADIIAKYLFYALTATATGAVCGMIFGMWLFPTVIITAYAMLYDIAVVLTPLDLPLAAATLIVSLAAVSVTVVFSCKNELAEQSAQLMRPKAPRVGKKILLERMSFLWKRFSFNSKVTARNIFRYKKRMLMTVIGVAGCTALTLTGFGLRDSISSIVDLQFDVIYNYDGFSYNDAEILDENEDEIADILADYNAEYIKIYEKQYTIQANNRNLSAYILVPEDVQKLKEYVNIRDRISKEFYEIKSGEAVITEKMSSLLGLRVGDEMQIKKSDTVIRSIKVSAICENYAQHYVYMDSQTFSSLFSEEVEYNMLFFKNELTEEQGATFSERMLKNEAVLGVSLNSGTSMTFENMLEALDYVIIIIICAAGALAFVVLYNLTNINISERIREIATLKVLGLYDKEVDGYIFRENIILTLMGAAVGLFLGTFLCGFVITTAEVDIVMFGREINVMSYVLAAVTTVVFSLIVTFYMHHHLKKIDMIEALKSVE